MSYEKLFLGDSEFAGFFAKIPWALNSGLQDRDALRETLLNEAERLAESAHRIQFSIVTPLWNTPPKILKESLFSCLAQTWPDWELILVDDCSTDRSHIPLVREFCARDPRIRFIQAEERGGISAGRNIGIGEATGDFIAFLDHDDLLHPQALGIFARQIVANPALNFLFTNEVKISESSDQLSDFFFKPPFELSTLIRANYVAHLVAIRPSLLSEAAIDGQIFRPHYDAVEDHDVYLRLALSGKVRPCHIPLFCYFWRKTAQSTASQIEAKPLVFERGREMLKENLGQSYPNLGVAIEDPGGPAETRLFNLKFSGGDEGKKLLVVVPFRDQVAMTLAALESLERQEHALDVRVVLVDNRSGAETRSSLQKWIGAGHRLQYEILDHPGPFNFARMNNQGVDRFGEDRDLLLFMNNDVTLTSLDTLAVLASELAANPQLGFVGIKLRYPGTGIIQHGGIKILSRKTDGGFDMIGHVNSVDEFVNDAHVIPAVSFALAMTRAETFSKLGGLDEDHYPNGFGDVDICFRAAQAGYQNFYLGTLEGQHSESSTRRRWCEDSELTFFNQQHADMICRSRLELMGYDTHLAWNRMARKNDAGQLVYDLPLRYRIADRLNDAAKKFTGPLHRIVRKRLR